MRTWHATLMAALFVMATLAGCTSGDGTFTITEPDAPGGAYTFEADVTADNYTWDMGDRLTILYGKTVTHTYDFTNGEVTVRLKARTGSAAPFDVTRSLVLGTGTNERPTFLLEAGANWLVPGESVKFSATGSRDPENDPLRFSWSCLREGDAVALGNHVHTGQSGLPDYAQAKPGTVTSRLATGPLPDATLSPPGDLCAALGSGTPMSTTATTLEGAFDNTGIYKVYMLATDAVHPTALGEFKVFVTKPSERPAPVQLFEFNGTFQGGAGNLQNLCTTANAGSCDTFEDSFSLPLAGLAGNLTVSYDVGAAGPTGFGNNLTVVLSREGADLTSSNGAQGSFALDPQDLAKGGYKVVVRLSRGADVDWTVAVDVRLNMDPAQVY